MEIKDLIGQYQLLTQEHVSAFLRTFKDKKEFQDAHVISSSSGERRIDKNIRVVQDYALNYESGLTESNWLNFIGFLLKKVSTQYFNDRSIPYDITKIEAINLLKYTEGGFYKPHIDSGASSHRELSAVIFLNNDYEGGMLQFFEPGSKKLTLEIKPQPGKVILWPSNFLYPHQATPVIKGTRFTIVSWMV